MSVHGKGLLTAWMAFYVTSAASAQDSLFVQATQQPSFVTAAGCQGCAPSAGNVVNAGPIDRKAALYARLAAHPLTIGEGCRSTVVCSSWAAERTFLFGSCKQFFNPGNKCDSYWDRCFRKHSAHPYGPGGIGVGPCEPGFSYLNR